MEFRQSPTHAQRFEQPSTRLVPVCLGIVLLLVPFATTVGAQSATPTWIPSGQLTDVHADTESEFGASIAVDNSVVVAGDPERGLVGVYERIASAWVRVADLSGPSGFGGSVAIDAGRVVVGTAADASAHVYTETDAGWTEQARLTVDGAGCYGAAVAVDGDRLAVSDPCTSDSVYLYEFVGSEWTRHATLEVAGEQGLGEAVDLAGSTLLVGSRGDTFVFERDGAGWALASHLAGAGGDSVSVSGDVGLVGTGDRALVYARTGAGWQLDAELEGTDAAPVGAFEDFGRAVALEGDVAIVGAPGEDATPGEPAQETEAAPPCVSILGVGACVPPSPGAAYIFEREVEGWVQTAKVFGNGAGEDRFGAAVAIGAAGTSVLAAAPGNFEAAIGGGVDVEFEDTVYAFSKLAGGVGP